MKVGVLDSLGEPPWFEEFPASTVHPGEALLNVAASPLSQFDRNMAACPLFASPRTFLAVAGSDGLTCKSKGASCLRRQ